MSKEVKLTPEAAKALMQAWSDNNEQVIKSGEKKPKREPTKEEVRRYLEAK